ncbi:MAG: DUF2306 domain-containing protein [Pseudobdellovibrionaceae bacterium]
MLTRNKDWLIILGLVLLSIVPAIGGAFRIVKISAGDSSLENARFLASPLLIFLHVVSAIAYSFLGALQFSKRIRNKWPRWHRETGKLLIGFSVIVAVTGLWMTLVYPLANHDGVAVFTARLVVGFTMLIFITLCIVAIWQKNFVSHGNWMIRAYALAMGAGTQVFTHIPSLIFPSLEGETNRSIAMILGWVINMVAAEWIILNSKAPVRSLSLFLEKPKKTRVLGLWL